MFIKSKEAYDRLVELNRDANEQLFITKKVTAEKERLDKKNSALLNQMKEKFK